MGDGQLAETLTACHSSLMTLACGLWPYDFLALVENILKRMTDVRRWLVMLVLGLLLLAAICRAPPFIHRQPGRHRLSHRQPRPRNRSHLRPSPPQPSSRQGQTSR